VTLIAHNSELLTGVGLAGGCLVVFGGGFAMSARGPARAALVVFATIGVGMLAVGGYAMYST
jgi:hypothetical protein